MYAPNVESKTKYSYAANHAYQHTNWRPDRYVVVGIHRTLSLAVCVHDLRGQHQHGFQGFCPCDKASRSADRLSVYSSPGTMPLLAMMLGHLAFGDDPYTITGLILGAAIPTGISSFVWVNIYKGNTALTLAIILIDTILAPFAVPGIMSLLVGADVQLDTWAMMQSLFWMIVVPSLIGMVLNEWTKGKIKQVWGPRLGPFSKLYHGSCRDD